MKLLPSPQKCFGTYFPVTLTPGRFRGLTSQAVTRVFVDAKKNNNRKLSNSIVITIGIMIKIIVTIVVKIIIIITFITITIIYNHYHP